MMHLMNGDVPRRDGHGRIVVMINKAVLENAHEEETTKAHHAFELIERTLYPAPVHTPRVRKIDYNSFVKPTLKNKAYAWSHTPHRTSNVRATCAVYSVYFTVDN